MVVFCSMINCKRKHGDGKGEISFHRFPIDDVDRCQLWANATGRENWSPNQNSYICSLHFDPSSYFEAKSRKRLKRDAVPNGIIIFDKDQKNIEIGSWQASAWPCEQCGASFAVSGLLAHHLSQCNQVNSINSIHYSCPNPKCTELTSMKKYQSIQSLDEHLSSEHVNEEDAVVFHCKYCTCHFNTILPYLQHLLAFHEMYATVESAIKSQTKSYFCPPCNQPFDNETNLVTHISQSTSCQGIVSLPQVELDQQNPSSISPDLALDLIDKSQSIEKKFDEKYVNYRIGVEYATYDTQQQEQQRVETPTETISTKPPTKTTSSKTTVQEPISDEEEYKITITSSGRKAKTRLLLSALMPSIGKDRRTKESSSSSTAAAGGTNKKQKVSKKDKGGKDVADVANRDKVNDRLFMKENDNDEAAAAVVVVVKGKNVAAKSGEAAGEFDLYDLENMDLFETPLFVESEEGRGGGVSGGAEVVDKSSSEKLTKIIDEHENKQSSSAAATDAANGNLVKHGKVSQSLASPPVASKPVKRTYTKKSANVSENLPETLPSETDQKTNIDDAEVEGDSSRENLKDRLKRIRALKKSKESSPVNKPSATLKPPAKKVKLEIKVDGDAVVKPSPATAVAANEERKTSDIKNESKAQPSLKSPPAPQRAAMAPSAATASVNPPKKQNLSKKSTSKSAAAAVAASATGSSSAAAGGGGGNLFTCPACCRTFATLGLRDKHFLQDHRGLKVFGCQICGSSYDTYQTFHGHCQRSHANEMDEAMYGGSDQDNMDYTCDICSLAFCRQHVLAKHVEQEHFTDEQAPPKRRRGRPSGSRKSQSGDNHQPPPAAPQQAPVKKITIVQQSKLASSTNGMNRPGSKTTTPTISSAVLSSSNGAAVDKTKPTFSAWQRLWLAFMGLKMSNLPEGKFPSSVCETTTCSICSDSFSNEVELCIHIQRDHVDMESESDSAYDKALGCHICYHLFLGPQAVPDIKAHMATVHKESNGTNNLSPPTTTAIPSPYLCNKCGTGFHRQQQWQWHTNGSSSEGVSTSNNRADGQQCNPLPHPSILNTSLYACPECSYIFAGDSAAQRLRDHMVTCSSNCEAS